jgi:RNA polymerase sigma-70 factor (ECF subfamily)
MFGYALAFVSNETPSVALEPVRPGGASDGPMLSAYAEHHEEVYTFLVRTTRDPETAEDLLQETFLRLLNEVRMGRTPENVRAWLYRVAANLATSRGRRQTTAKRWLGWLVERGTQEAPEEGYLRRERDSALERAIAKLPDDARVAILLSGHGFSGTQIAEAIGRSEGATRVLLTRTRLRLRQLLEAEGVTR